FALELFVEGLARDERHDVKQLAFELAGIVDRQNVRVTQTRNDVDFSTEALGSQGECELAQEDLHGDVAIELEILRQPDDRHPAATDLALESIALAQHHPGL